MTICDAYRSSARRRHADQGLDIVQRFFPFREASSSYLGGCARKQQRLNIDSHVLQSSTHVILEQVCIAESIDSVFVWIFLNGQACIQTYESSPSVGLRGWHGRHE